MFIQNEQQGTSCGLKAIHWAVVVARLAQQLLLTQEDPGSNTAIGIFYKEH